MNHCDRQAPVIVREYGFDSELRSNFATSSIYYKSDDIDILIYRPVGYDRYGSNFVRHLQKLIKPTRYTSQLK